MSAKANLLNVAKNIYFQKKTPVSLIHFLTNRCNAKRANNEQCTRRRKEGSEYCGTHVKGVPHGLVTADNMNEHTTKLEVIATEIMGIVYYIDNNKNVYNTEDIMNQSQTPRIIAKYENHSGTITIPELGLV